MNFSLTWPRTAAAPAAACQQAWLKISRSLAMVTGIAPRVCAQAHTSGKGSVATRVKGDVPL